MIDMIDAKSQIEGRTVSRLPKMSDTEIALIKGLLYTNLITYI